MKLMHVFFVVALWAKLAAGSATAAEANRFECTGEAQIVILHRSLDSSIARLQVSNLGFGEDMAEFQLDRVSVRQDLMGVMAWGYYRGIADMAVTFALIVPTVLIVDDQQVSGVEGMLIRSVAGLLPPPTSNSISGPRQSLLFSPVSCIASLRGNPV